MSDAETFREIIELWPTREAMAAEVGARPAAVSKWWQRKAIPDEWWSSVLSTETARSHGITADLLVQLAAREVAA